ncbi:MAG: hypothetical protein ACKVE3_04690 [Dissulfuribacterales bacterium]
MADQENMGEKPDNVSSLASRHKRLAKEYCVGSMRLLWETSDMKYPVLVYILENVLPESETDACQSGTIG